MLLSVVIPVYNEEATLREIVARVRAIRLPGIDKEVLLVDDASKDRSHAIMLELEQEAQADGGDPIRTFQHEKNKGKGAALRTGFEQVRGDLVIVQDADLEYDPAEYPKLLKPILDGHADVVFGSRFVGGDSHRVHFFWHMVANKFITLMSNCFSNLNLTDIETCYKVFRREVIDKVKIRENRFGFEPEITAKVAKQRCRVYEVGIAYYGRSYEEGKKIGWRDGVRALYCIVRYSWFR
jgi:glycosyltransferase involved in cell wall biosynthesis